MDLFEIDISSYDSVIDSFDRIATELFRNYKLIVNQAEYRLLDLEFYYFDSKVYRDVYAHQHPLQLQSGKWYFHGSGVDITIGNGSNFGGILIRAIAKISVDASLNEYSIEKEIHGSLNVVTEIGSNFAGALQEKLNKFGLCNIETERMGALMKLPPYIIKTTRIGLRSDKDTSNEKPFYNGKFRYVIFPYLKLRNKTQIARDFHEQHPELTLAQVNKEFGSKFL